MQPLARVLSLMATHALTVGADSRLVYLQSWCQLTNEGSCACLHKIKVACTSSSGPRIACTAFRIPGWVDRSKAQRKNRWVIAAYSTLRPSRVSNSSNPARNFCASPVDMIRIGCTKPSRSYLSICSRERLLTICFSIRDDATMLPGKGFDRGSNLAVGEKALKIFRSVKSQISSFRISAKIFQPLAFDFQFAVPECTPARAANAGDLRVDLG